MLTVNVRRQPLLAADNVDSQCGLTSNVSRQTMWVGSQCGLTTNVSRQTMLTVNVRRQPMLADKQC